MSGRPAAVVVTVIAALLVGACSSEAAPELSPRQRVVERLRELTEEIQREAAIDPAIDVDGLRAQALESLSASTEDDLRAAIVATDLFLRGLRKGHTGIHLAPERGREAAELVCPEGLAPAHRNGVGACLAPREDRFVVSFAQDGNPLGLRPGDQIVAIGDRRGEVLFEHYGTLPACGAFSPSASGRRTKAAQAALALTEPGTDVEVVDVSGATRIVEMPEQPTRELICVDALGRPHDAPPSVTVRPDGVRVLRLASFGLEAGTATPQERQELLLTAIAELNVAENVIWDLRGNRGGYAGFDRAAAGLLPGAREDVVLRCENTVPELEEQGPLRLPVPRGNVKRAAVLVDGGTYSAGSNFVRLASRATSAILVGTEEGGAYSNIPGTFSMPGFDVVYDKSLCRDAVTGEVAEGHPVPVDIRVELDPVDIANGRDTVLETAARALLEAR